MDRFKLPLVLVALGLFLVGVAVLFFRRDLFGGSTKVEILEDGGETAKELVVEISGGVQSPGVYRFQGGERIEDALIKAGGLSAEADRDWVDKTLNRAAKLVDGQKIFIPVSGSQSAGSGANNSGVVQTVSGVSTTYSSGLVSINTATAKELDALPGIGPVYAQSIIAQRPYSNTEELLSKGVLKKYVYEKIKNLISVY